MKEKISKSIIALLTLGAILNIASFALAQEISQPYPLPQEYNLTQDSKNALHLLYTAKTSEEVYYTNSTDNGQTWGPPYAISSAEGKTFLPLITSSDDNILYAIWVEKGSPEAICFSTSFNEGLSWATPILVSQKIGSTESAALGVSMDYVLYLSIKGVINGEESLFLISSPDGGFSWETPEKVSINIPAKKLSLFFDSKNYPHICWVTGEAGNYQILDTTLDAARTGWLPPVTIAKNILSPPQNIKTSLSKEGVLFAFWEETNQLYFSRSLDNGSHWGTPQQIDLPLLSISHITLAPPTAPTLISETEKLITNNSFLPLSFYPPADPDHEIFKYQAEVCPDQFFDSGNTQTFAQLEKTVSAEINQVIIPLTFSDGIYFCRLRSWDGLSYSRPSLPQKIVLDTTSPEVITLDLKGTFPLEPQTIKGDLATLEVVFSEAMDLNIVPLISAEGRKTFPAQVQWQDEKTLLATFLFAEENPDDAYALSWGNLFDQAANSLKTPPPFIFTIDTQSPQIKVSNPCPADWFGPGTTILFEASVSDQQDNLAAEEEAVITMAGAPLEGFLTYNKEEQKISGFLTLPEELYHGSHEAIATITDSQGNTGGVIFTVSIDAQGPTLGLATLSHSFTKQNSKVAIPLFDIGSGVDFKNSTISVFCQGITLEGEVTHEENKLIFTPYHPLADMPYNVEVLPCDQTGNWGKLYNLSLTVDTIPPEVTILSPQELETKHARIVLEGTVNDPAVQSINVDSGGRAQTIPVAAGTFKCPLNLSPGLNTITVNATDPAGNYGSAVISIASSASSQPLQILHPLAGPSPYNGQGNVNLVYELTKDADEQIYLYSMNGELIWHTAVFGVQGTNEATWNGRNLFGEAVPSGVYTYIIVSQAIDGSGEKTITRGKIAVLR